MGAVHAEGPVSPPKGELNPWPLASEYPRRPISQPNPQLSSDVRRRKVCARTIKKTRTRKENRNNQPTECAKVCQCGRCADSDGPAVGAVSVVWVFKCIENNGNCTVCKPVHVALRRCSRVRNQLEYPSQPA